MLLDSSFILSRIKWHILECCYVAVFISLLYERKLLPSLKLTTMLNQQHLVFVIIVGGDHMAESITGRVFLSSWWIFTLTIMAVYSGNLVAFLTVSKEVLDFNGMANGASSEGLYTWTFSTWVDQRLCIPSLQKQTFHSVCTLTLCTKWIAVLHSYKCKIRAYMNRIFKNPANIEAYMEFRKNPPVFSQTYFFFTGECKPQAGFWAHRWGVK